jgi:hypothetical protein
MDVGRRSSQICSKVAPGTEISPSFPRHEAVESPVSNTAYASPFVSLVRFKKQNIGGGGDVEYYVCTPH